MDELLKWRQEFPILGETTYMISHSLAPMPREVFGAMQEFAQTWATRGIRAWEEGWWEMPVTVGDMVGGIIGAAPGTVVMHQNVSVCQTIVTSCFDWSGRRNKLVTDGLNFPSNDYIYGEEGAKPGGPRVVRVEAEDGMTLELQRLLDAIDEETLLVSVSHVAFRSSSLLDLQAITEKAHKVGARVMADLYQSAGIVPVDVTSLGVDFAVGGSVKWLLGGPGNGYLYVRPDLIETLRPAATGWAAHEAPFEFAAAPIRFDRGDPAVFEWDAKCAGAVRGAGRVRDGGGDWGGGDSGEICAADAADDRAGGCCRARGADGARSGDARGGGHL